MRSLKIALILAISFAAGLWGWPALKRHWILSEHRNLKLGTDPALLANGWGWARRSQLHDRRTGPWLLRDRQLVDRRIQALADDDKSGGNNQQLIKYRGEWALMFAALRLQGLRNQDILKSQHGLSLTLATLAAEADPPRWWTQQAWIGQQVLASPVGSFHMGLLKPEEVTGLVEKAPQMGEHQLPCMLHCMLRHNEGFTQDQRTAVLEAWLKQQSHFFSPNNKASVERVLAARQRVMQLLGPPRPLRAQIFFAVGFTSDQQAALERLIEDFLRSCGYLPGVASFPMDLGLEALDYDSVATDYFVPYEATERVAVPTYQPGRYTVSYRYKERKVTRQDRRTQVGEATVPSLVMVLRPPGREALRLDAPPYGEVTQDTLAKVLSALNKLEPDQSEKSDLDWYVKQNASSPWRYGLSGYDRDWNVEERMK